MLFNVYHKKTEQLVHYLTHSTIDRVDSGNMVRCTFNGHEHTFIFLDRPDYTDDNAYHIIIKQFAFPSQLHEDPYFFLQDVDGYSDILDLGYPHNVEAEYDMILNNIDLSKKWILMWSYGENPFTRIGYNKWSQNSEMIKLSKLTTTTRFFIDTLESSTKYNVNDFGLEFNLKTALTQDIYMWNVTAGIRWAYEFKDIFKNLNPEYQFCLALRNPKPTRLKFFKDLNSLNNSNIYLSQYDLLFEKNKGKVVTAFPELTWDGYKEDLEKLQNIHWNKVNNEGDDFSNLDSVGNREISRFEFDYYFRILPKAKVQILDETMTLQHDYKIPQFLSEKTYILLLANVPFISTHQYPLDVIKKLIIDIDYPYYEEISDFENNEDGFRNFIQKFSENFDTMYPPLIEYTTKVHNALLYKIKNNNSLLENIISEINQ